MTKILPRAPHFPLRVQDESLTKIIIADIDGTIADRGERDPHDLNYVIEDTPKLHIINLIKVLSHQYPIYFFTGRKEICRDQTEHWLEIMFNQTSGPVYLDRNINPFNLFMRKNDDNRKDNIVKKEMFEEYIDGKLYVEAVLDDRQQVVDMWRQKVGVTCLQVYYGDF